MPQSFKKSPGHQGSQTPAPTLGCHQLEQRDPSCSRRASSSPTGPPRGRQSRCNRIRRRRSPKTHLQREGDTVSPASQGDHGGGPPGRAESSRMEPGWWRASAPSCLWWLPWHLLLFCCPQSPGVGRALTAGPLVALQHLLQRVRDPPDPLVQVGGRVLEQRPRGRSRDSVVLGCQESIPTGRVPSPEDGQKHSSRYVRGTGSSFGLHQRGFLLPQGASRCFLDLSEPSGPYRTTPRSRGPSPRGGVWEDLLQ